MNICDSSSLVSPVQTVSATQLDVPPAAVPTNELPDSVYVPPADPVVPAPADDVAPPPPPGSPQEAEEIALEAAIEEEQSQIEASFTEIEVLPSPPVEDPQVSFESGDPGIEEFADLGTAPANFAPAGSGLRREGGSSGCSPGPNPAYNASVETVTTLTNVRNNAAGTFTLSIRNTGTTAWPAGWAVATQVLDSNTQPFGALGPATNVSAALAPNSTANVTVTVPALTPGSWWTSWEISVPPVGSLRSLGVCSVWALPVYNVAPSLTLKSPLEYGTVTTNRPFLVVSGTDSDGYPVGATLTYEFRVCLDAALTQACQTSGWTSATSWQPPNQLLWGSYYYWTATVSDGVSTLSALTGHPNGYKFAVVVPAADDWRQVGNGLGLANAFGVVLPYGVFVHTERDAEVNTVNVPLAIDRTFSSGAVGTEGAFGNGWMSVFDTAYVKQSSDLYRITYTDGRQETFGRNPNGDFISRADLGLSNKLTVNPDNTVKVVQSGTETLYFSASGRLTKVEYPELGSLEFAYTNANITTITQQPSGRQIQVEWSLSGQSCSASSGTAEG